MQKMNYLNLNGRLLKLFIAIYDTNSVSLTAAQFDLNQSTVSHSLEKLRACLGDPLFVKSGRGIIPTEFAIALVPRARALLASLESLTNHVDYQPYSDTRPISIALNTLEMMPLCVRLSDIFMHLAPNAPFRLLTLGSPENVKPLLESGRVDLVISFRTQLPIESLNSWVLYTEDQVCYYDPNSRGPIRSLEDYCAAHHAVLDYGRKKMSLVDLALEKVMAKRTIMLYAPNVQAIAQLLKGTDMIFTKQLSLHSSVFSNLDYCTLPFPFPKLQIDMIWHRRAEHSDRNSWLRDLVMSVPPEGVFSEGI